MATFTAMVKIYSTKYFCNIKVAKFLSIKNVHVYRILPTLTRFLMMMALSLFAFPLSTFCSSVCTSLS